MAERNCQYSISKAEFIAVWNEVGEIMGENSQPYENVTRVPDTERLCKYKLANLKGSAQCTHPDIDDVRQCPYAQSIVQAMNGISPN